MDSVKHSARKLIFSYKATPFVLLLLVIISYGLVISKLGFFMDDWYLIWYKHLFGAIQFPAYFSLDRPLMGYFYVAANFLLGNTESPFLWQLFGLFTRWLCVYALWGFINTLWPSAKRQNALICMLAAVFPGFVQQWIAIIYSFFFTCLACFFFSLTLMLKALHNPKRFWLYLTFSLLIGFYAYAAAEFYFGLELIRPLVLWIEYSRSIPIRKTRLRKTLVGWIPFLVVYLVYAVWRAFFFTSVNHGVEVTHQLKQSPFSLLSDLFSRIYQAILDGAVNAWTNPLNLSNYPTRGIVPLVILALVGVVFLLASFWLIKTIKIESPTAEDEQKGWYQEAFWLALISMVVAILPFWAANLPVDYLYPYDRFLLAYLFGSCTLLVVFLDGRKWGWFLLTFLIAVSCGYQLNTSIRYKNTWQQQVEFFWQLSWRVPALEQNTVIITDDLPFSKYYTGTSLMAPLNMIYAPNLNSHSIPYLILLNEHQDDIINDYVNNGQIDFNFRSFKYSGDTSNILLLKKPAEGCLRVVLPTDPTQSVAKKETLGFWEKMLPYSHPDRISTAPTTAAQPMKKFFGDENQDQWCYYFEKADLARQQQNWSETIQYYKEAEDAGFTPTIDSEWIPLVDAYLHLDKIEQAEKATYQVNNTDQANTTSFCKMWAEASANENVLPFAEEMLSWLNCRVTDEN